MKPLVGTMWVMVASAVAGFASVLLLRDGPAEQGPGGLQESSQGLDGRSQIASPIPSDLQPQVTPPRIPAAVPLSEQHDLVTMSTLTGPAKVAAHSVNQLLRRAKLPVIASDDVITRADIAVLEAVVAADIKFVDEADLAIRRMQSPYAAEMRQSIQKALADGKPPPFENISISGLPSNKHPYDCFITCAIGGQTYLMSMPYTPDVMDHVDRLRAARDLQLANARDIIRPLFKKGETQK